MRFGVFTDSHICNSDDLGLGRRPRLARGRLISLMEKGEAATIGEALAMENNK
jgi:hypothetical protein